VRLFVAVELDASVRSRMRDAQDRLARVCEGVRWIPAEQLHLTLKFLGEVADGVVAKAGEAVARAAAGSQAFTMSLAGCGCFPPRGPVRIVWIGVNEESGRLAGCFDAVERELGALGFPKEDRGFSPHITIGRAREDRSDGRIRAGVSAAAFGPVEQPVVSLTLMSSLLSPKGPTYTPVGTAKLGG
jgi:2'-5' RNA ligase